MIRSTESTVTSTQTETTIVVTIVADTAYVGTLTEIECACLAQYLKAEAKRWARKKKGRAE